jgi:hypothetical protein
MGWTFKTKNQKIFGIYTRMHYTALQYSENIFLRYRMTLDETSLATFTRRRRGCRFTFIQSWTFSVRCPPAGETYLIGVFLLFFVVKNSVNPRLKNRL